MLPAFEVLLGKNEQPLTALALQRADIRMSINRIPAAELVLSDAGDGTDELESMASVAEQCRPGTELSIGIAKGALLFSGVVVQQALKISKGRAELTLKLRHPLQRLTATYGSELFEKLSDADIIRKVLSRQGVKLDRLEEMTFKHEQLIKFCCSDWQFVKTRLWAHGVWLLPNVAGAAIVKPALKPKAEHTLYRVSPSTEKTPIGIHEMQLQFSNAMQPKALEISSWDLKTQKQSAAAKAELKPSALGRDGLDPAALAALGEQPWVWARNLAMDQEERLALAQSRLLAQRSAGVQGSFTVAGSAQYQLGQTLALSGFGKPFDGAGLISGIQHSIVPGSWGTTLSLGQEHQRALDAELLPAAPGLHIGIAAAYKKDPDNLNRLQVRVPALNLGEKAIWARFAAPYASKARGVCFYPEAGDEVVLGFFGDDPRYPVILGAMHNPKNKPPFAPSKKNKEKGLVFGAGSKHQQLVFDTEEESIALGVAATVIGIPLKSTSLSLSVDDGHALSSTQGIRLQSDKAMALDAKEKLALTGAKAVAIKGKEVSLDK